MATSYDLGAVSTYALAVQYGFVGTIADWVQAIVSASETYDTLVEQIESLELNIPLLDSTLSYNDRAANAYSVGEYLRRLETLISTPLASSTIAGMTDTTKVYVYTGSETGYTAGNWYYYNGTAWVSGGVYNAEAIATDTTLTIAGSAADAKKVGDELADIRQDIQDIIDHGTGGGMSAEFKQALHDIFEKVAYIDGDGTDYLNALDNAMNPPKNLTSITCVYTQSGAVYTTDSLDVLKDDLVVTAHYDDSSTSIVTTYTLSGTLTAGTSTIIVSYNGKTTTFNVTVTAALAENFVKVNSPVINNKILEKSTTNVGYIRTNKIFSPGSSTWNIMFKFTPFANGSTFQDIIDSVDSNNDHVRAMIIEMSQGRLFRYFASSGAESWDIENSGSGDAITVVSDTEYYLDVYYDGVGYGYNISTDNGETWTKYGGYPKTKLIAGDVYLAFGKYVNGEFNGEIDLSSLKIYIDDILWWQAYGDLPTVSSISAVYTQSGEVYESTSLDSLKSDLVVTATYSDASTRTLSSSEYTLSGTLTEGTSTVTVTYEGKTTTFNVTVTEVPSVFTGYTEVGSPTITSNILTVEDGKFIKSNQLFSPGNDTWAVRCKYRKTTGLSNYSDIFGGVDSSNASVRTLLFELNNGSGSSVGLFLSSNNSSWDISGTGTNPITEPTSWVWAEIAYDGTDYTLKYSSDGTTWSTSKTVTSASKVYGGYAIGFGLKRNGYFKGEIDLTGCEIYIGGNLWWKAVA